MKSAESARQPSVTTNSSAVAAIAAIRPAMRTTHSASRPYTSALSFDTSAPLAPNAHSNFEKCACRIPAADVSGRTTAFCVSGSITSSSPLVPSLRAAVALRISLCFGAVIGIRSAGTAARIAQIPGMSAKNAMIVHSTPSSCTAHGAASGSSTAPKAPEKLRSGEPTPPSHVYATEPSHAHRAYGMPTAASHATPQPHLQPPRLT